MPIELKPKISAEEAKAPEESTGLTLFNEDGELTLAGETVADFLEAADFSAVTESPDALPFLSNPSVSVEDPYDVSEGGEDDAEDGDAGDDKEGDEKPAEKPAEKPEEAPDEKPAEEPAADADADVSEEEVAEVALPGAVAARLVDDDDLTEMFGYFLDHLAETEDPTLQDQAVLAVFADYRDDDGGILEDKRAEVAEMLKSVLSEGVVYDAAEEIDERFLTKGARIKSARIRRKPKSGKRRMELKKRRREEGRGAKKAKIGRQKKMFKRKRASRIKMLARESEEGTLIFGLGEGINGANIKIGLAESPDLEFTSDELIEFDVLSGNVFACPDESCGNVAPFFVYIQEAKKKAKKKKDSDGDCDGSPQGEMGEGVCPECGCIIESLLDEKGKLPPAFLKNMKKKGKKKDSDGDNDDSSKDEKASKKDEHVAPSHVPGAFAVAAGRPDLSEGSSLAAATLGVLGHRKPLTESGD